MNKPFRSNVPSSHRTNALAHYQPGFEVQVEDDFVTNVESIKPLHNDNTSVNQASNSLFIQSGRSRNNKTARSPGSID